MTKSEIRKKFLELRSKLSQDEVREQSQLIAESLSELNLTGTGSVFISLERFNEVDTTFIIEKLNKFCRLTAPKMSGDDLQHILFDSKSKFERGPFGVLEPTGTNLVEPQELDFVIVPLLAVDAKGNRIGYGKGFYDRFLSKCNENCKFIGVSFFDVVDFQFETNEFDVPLHFLQTPRKTYAF